MNNSSGWNSATVFTSLMDSDFWASLQVNNSDRRRHHGNRSHGGGNITHTPMGLLFGVGPLVGCTLSAIATGWLLVFLLRLKKEHRGKLMARQLLHLCIGSLIWNLFGVLSAGTWFLTLPEHERSDEVCQALAFMNKFGFSVSIFSETHLAIAFVAAFYRWSFLLKVLRRCLPCVYVLAVFCAVEEVISGSMKWTFGIGCGRHLGDHVFGTEVVVCVLICGLCYVVCLVGFRRTSQAVQLRVWNRANRYMIVALVTLGPDAIRTTHPTPWHHEARQFAEVLAVTLLSLNGLLLVLVYATQSRYIRQRSRRFFRQPGELAEASNATDRSGQLEHSFHVRFDEVPRVHWVTAVQAEANARAEAEAVAVCRARIQAEVTLRERSRSVSGESCSDDPPAGRDELFESCDVEEVLLGCFELDHPVAPRRQERSPTATFMVGPPPTYEAHLGPDIVFRQERSPTATFMVGPPPTYASHLRLDCLPPELKSPTLNPAERPVDLPPALTMITTTTTTITGTTITGTTMTEDRITTTTTTTMSSAHNLTSQPAAHSHEFQSPTFSMLERPCSPPTESKSAARTLVERPSEQK